MHRPAIQGGSVPLPSPGTPGREVFLSPRVLDQGAFEELAGALRDLLRGASDEASALRGALEGAQRVRADIAESAGKQRATLEISSKLLKALTARAESLEQTLVRVENGQSLLDRLSLESERLVANRLTALETRLSESARAVELRLGSAGERGRSTATALEAIVSRASDLVEPHPRTGDRPSLSTLVERAETAREDLNTLSGRLDRAHIDATKSTVRLSDSLGGCMKLQDGLEARGQMLVRSIETSLARAERSAQDAADMTASVRELAETLDAATNRAMMEREALASDAARVERAATRAEEAVGQAREVVRALEAWRPILDGEAITPQSLPPALAKIVELFRREVGQDLVRMASAMQTVAERVEPSSRAPRPTHNPEVVVRRGQSGSATEAA